MLKLLPIITFTFLLFSTNIAKAQNPGTSENFSKGRVTNLLEDKILNIEGIINPYQKVELELLDKPYTGKKITVDHGGAYTIVENQKVKVGDVILVNIIENEGAAPTYWIVDKYRLSGVAFISIAFLILVFLVAGKKGMGAMLGMALSFAVIVKFIVPQILEGKDPLVISIIGGLFIMFSTMYLAHGYSHQTTVSVIATFLSLCLSGILAHYFVQMTSLFGTGNEDAYSLQFGTTSVINLKGLLLGGIIIGVLGVLDDVTTTQTATIFELKSANKNLTFNKLVVKGFAVGTEHVASLVNTLIMAYAGVSLPLFILFVLNPQSHPLWVILNNEVIVEEFVRSLAGSFGLVFAVPLTTFLAAFVAVRLKKIPKVKHSHTHSHHHH